MFLRILAARFILRTSKLIESPRVMVLRPDVLVEFDRQIYTCPHDVAAWSCDDLAQPGLNLDEQILLDKLPLKQGRLLLLEVDSARGCAVSGLPGASEHPGEVERDTWRTRIRDFVLETV
jgi:hypothetical protein